MKKRRLFRATVARQTEDGTWLLMNKRENGWASFAYPYPTLDAIVADWDVTIGDLGIDEFSTYRHVIPKE